MGHLILYAACVAVAALAMRPKISLAMLCTIPVALAIGETWAPDWVPDWLLITGMCATALCLAAVLVGMLFRRGSEDGDLPWGREVRYSAADKAGLRYTFVLLCIAAACSAFAAWRPPYQSGVMRIFAVLLVPVFAAFAWSFMRLLRDREIVVLIHEHALEINGRRIPWQDIAGQSFFFGVLRVDAKSGERLLRVDNTIDGFAALLYHVNRKTFRNVT